MVSNIVFPHSVKIAGIVYMKVACGEQIVVQINEIIIGHAGNIVHHDLIIFFLPIGDLPLMGTGIYVIDMMGKDGGMKLVLF